MFGFIVRRFLWAIFIFVVATIITYVLFWIVPADPANLHAGSTPGPAYVREMRHYLRLDQPIWRQYVSFVWGLVGHGSLGSSLQNRQPVMTIIGKDAPVTASLVLGGAVLWLTVSVPIGIFAAYRPRSWFDRFSMILVLCGISAHPVWLGLISSYVFGYKLGLTPIAGYCDFFSGSTTCSGPVQWAYHLVLPWTTFMILYAALYVRLVRASLLETLTEDYVRTARAKGASAKRVLVSHGLRNSLLPVVTIFGMDVGLALGGAIFTEVIYDLPGLGRELINAYSLDDEPLIVGIVLFSATCVLAFNFIIDVAYGFLDPRVRGR